MSCNRKGTKSAEVPAVFEGYQAEGNDNQEDSLLMDVPPEQERGISAESDSAHESIPIGIEP